MAFALQLSSLLSSSANAQARCEDAFADTLSHRTLEAIAHAAGVPPVWDDYSLARHPLLLLAARTSRDLPDSPVCAAIWRHGRPLERLELPVRPPIATPFWGMVVTDPPGLHPLPGSSELPVVRTPAPPGVTALLEARGVRRAVVLNLPMILSDLGRLGEVLQKSGADPAIIQTELAVHESYHLHAQFPAWLDQPRTYAWPLWDAQPDRGEVRQRCYAGSSELVTALEQEVAALLGAFDAIFPGSGEGDRAAARRESRRFVSLRAARRALQDTITVAQGGHRIACRQAEDLLELEEGAAQWIGHATMARAGLRSRASLRASYGTTQPDQFYRTGPLQLWILEGLLGPEPLRRLTAAMVRSTSPGEPGATLFSLFDDQTRQEGN